MFSAKSLAGPRRLITALLVLGAFWCRPALAKDELAIGITQFPATFHPAIESMLAKTYVLSMARRPITAFDARWELVCMLCERLPTMENGGARREDLPGGGTGVAVTYTLRADAFWGDGTPVTTRDVLLGWKVGRHPQSGVASGEIYRRVTAIDVADDRTFTLHFDRLTFDYNAINDFQILPAHVEEQVFDAGPAEYRNHTRYDLDTANPALWNGPYRITKVVQGSHLVLERNAYWRGEKPAFARIVVRAVENTAALEANLMAGGVDMVAGELGLPLEQAVAFEHRHGQDYRVFFKPSLSYEHLEIDLSNPALADLRVRRALLMGIDREAISNHLFAGRQPVAHSSVPPLDWIYSDKVRTYPYAPDQAAKLLDEAGWHLSDGVRRDGQGRPLALELATTAGNRSRELVAQVLQAQWRDLGVEVRVRTQSPRVFFGDTVTKRKFPGMAMFAWYSAPENVPRSTLHSDMIPSAANNWAGQNYGGYKNPAMDKLIDAIEVELDRTKRKALWQDLQQLYAEDLPALPLYFKADAHIWPKALTGVVPTGHQDPSTLWVEEWRWRE